jgi:hypothetical protein
VLNLYPRRHVEEHGTSVAYTGLARSLWLIKMRLAGPFTRFIIYVAFLQLMKSFYVLAFVIGWQTNVGFVNCHCHKKEIKRRIIIDSLIQHSLQKYSP